MACEDECCARTRGSSDGCNELSWLYLADPELSAAYTTCDLIRFSSGRNTVCKHPNLRRSFSAPRLRSSPAPSSLPPPQPFRRAGNSNRRPNARIMNNSIFGTGSLDSSQLQSEPTFSTNFDVGLFDMLFEATMQPARL